MRGVTPTPARSHPENGGMAPHQFFENNYFSEANQLRVLTVHEGHMGHYHHWRTDDSSSSCFSAIVNVGKMRGVTPTDATASRLNVELGSLCPFFASRATYFQLVLVPPGFPQPQGDFMVKFLPLSSIKFWPNHQISPHLQNSLNTSIKITGNGLISPLVSYFECGNPVVYPPHYHRAI